jgi:hypothetical protein
MKNINLNAWCQPPHQFIENLNCILVNAWAAVNDAPDIYVTNFQIFFTTGQS